jgi:VWFA-related protein
MTPRFSMRSYSAALVFPAVLLFPFVASASPQSQSKPDTSNTTTEQPYVIRSSTRLVQVNVVVQNEKGVPITGLKKEDFTVLDNGKPQEIAFFSAAVPSHTVPRPLAPMVFTNRSDLKGQDPGATVVILFDSLNTSFEDQAYARHHILRFLQSVKPQDRVAIFALTTHLLALHDFTEDVASLQSSVARFSPQLLAAFDASHPDNFHVPALASDPSWRVFEGHVNNASGEIADSYIINRFQITYAAVLALADYVANIPGHKSLVWVSDGIPIQLGSDRIGIPDRDDFRIDNSSVPGMPGSSDLSGLARLLNRVDMAIYPIDAHGVEVDDSASAFHMRQDQRDSFRVLADDTGGKAFYGTNDITGAINSAVEDNRYTYALGFYPNHGVWDGKFRKIKINLDVSGSRLRYRRGYFAFRERSENEVTMRTDLAEAGRSPLDATALGVTVRGKTLAPTSTRRLQLQVTLDAKQFLLHDQDNRKQGGLDLLFLQKDSAGNFLAAEKQHFDVNFKPREYDALAKSGLVLQHRLSINPTAAEIRVLVRDSGSGSLGSVTFPVKTFF